nr:MAG TPA: hypothetical protein [Ackermannviridae sp.]
MLLNIFCCCRVGNDQFRDRSPRRFPRLVNKQTF